MSRASWLLLASLLLACRDNNVGAPIRIVLGPQPGDDVTLAPRASLAEYVEISVTEGALLLTLSSAERSCDSAPDPGRETITVSVRLTLPGGAKLEPGNYPILTPGQDPKQAHALPTVKLRGRRHELRPGGSLELRHVDLSPQGSLEGLLKFDFPGDAAHPATRVSGRFLAHFCRINRLR